MCALVCGCMYGHEFVYVCVCVFVCMHECVVFLSACVCFHKTYGCVYLYMSMCVCSSVYLSAWCVYV